MYAKRIFMRFNQKEQSTWSTYFRLTQFVVSVGYSLDDLTVCTAEYTGIVGSAASVDIPCAIRGRYVHFKRLGGYQIHVVILCEVVVTGKELTDCSNCAEGIPCSDLMGCELCDPGKQLPTCTDDCPDGVYGQNCSTSCGHCNRPSECHTIGGECSSGCENWWVGTQCKVEIVLPNYTNETIYIDNDATTTSSLTVIWQQIPNLPLEDGQYYRYRVECVLDANGQLIYDVFMSSPDQSAISAKIPDLDYNQEYKVRIVPQRKNMLYVEWGHAYPYQTATTKCGYPDTPSLTQLATDQDQSKITVEWGSVTDLLSRCDAVSSLMVEYGLLSQQDWLVDEIQQQDWENRQHTIIPQYGGEYEVKITVVNNENFASSSETRTVNILGPTTPVPITTTPTPTTTMTTASVTTSSKTINNGDADRRLIIIVVTVIVVVIILSVAGIVAVVLVLRYRRQRQPEGHSTPVNQPHYQNVRPVNLPHGQNVRPIASDNAVNQSDDYEMVGTVPQVLSDDMETKPYECLHHKETVYENDPGKLVYEEIK